MIDKRRREPVKRCILRGHIIKVAVKEIIFFSFIPPFEKLGYYEAKDTTVLRPDGKSLKENFTL